MIRYPDSFEAAKNVLQGLMDDPRATEIDAYVGSYQNGREQGYSISRSGQAGYEKTIYFSEYRSSDNIVVYFGRHSMQSISDELYDSKKFFSYDDITGAVDYIYQCLKSCETFND